MRSRRQAPRAGASGPAPWLLGGFLVGLLATACSGGDPAAPRTETPQVVGLRDQTVAYAGFIEGGPVVADLSGPVPVLGVDGTEWEVSRSEEGISLRSVDGGTTETVPGVFAEEIVVGPGGTVWVAGVTPLDAGDAPAVERRVVLASLDGSEWTVHPASPVVGPLALSTALRQPLTKLSVLEVAPDGSVWVGFGDEVDEEPSGDSGSDVPGLLRYAAGEWESVHTHPTNDVMDVAAGPDGILWVLVDEAGCPHEQLTVSGRQRFLLCDALARFDGTGWRVWGPGGGLVFRAFRSLITDSGGSLWLVAIPSYDFSQLIRFDGGLWLETRLPVPQTAVLGLGPQDTITFTVGWDVFAYRPPGG